MIISGWGKKGKNAFQYVDTEQLKVCLISITFIFKHVTTESTIQKANVLAYSNSQCCTQRFNANDCATRRQLIDDSIICAGSTTTPVGICFGDSGGKWFYL